MRKNETQIVYHQDYEEFITSQSASVPQGISEIILHKVHRDLNPTWLQVFTKISSIHLASALITLFFCPQFGLSFASDMGLMHYLMKLGKEFCSVGCGVFFTALSFLIASFYLKPEEIKILKRGKVLQSLVLVTLSAGVLLIFGGDVIQTQTVFWIFGAVMGAVIFLELGWLLRLTLREK